MIKLKDIILENVTLYSVDIVLVTDKDVNFTEVIDGIRGIRKITTVNANTPKETETKNRSRTDNKEIHTATIKFIGGQNPKQDLDFFTSVNVNVREVWDGVDDKMQTYERFDGLHHSVVMGCAYYLAETLNEEQLLMLFNILIRLVTTDKELAYMEYVSLELITSVIVPSMDFDNVEQTLTEYGVTILKE